MVMNINLVLLTAWYSMARIQEEKPDLTMKSQPPSYLEPVYFPKANVDEHGSVLIGSKIRYHSGENGKIMECTIWDSGTSYPKGDWFLVTYDNDIHDTAVEIMASDMDDILKNRVVTYT
jgi:hypothetical protein